MVAICRLYRLCGPSPRLTIAVLLREYGCAADAGQIDRRGITVSPADEPKASRPVVAADSPWLVRRRKRAPYFNILISIFRNSIGAPSDCSRILPLVASPLVP